MRKSNSMNPPDLVTLPSGNQVSMLWLRRLAAGFASHADIQQLLTMELQDVAYIAAEWSPSKNDL
jgi:hypothetical protein